MSYIDLQNKFVECYVNRLVRWNPYADYVLSSLPMIKSDSRLIIDSSQDLISRKECTGHVIRKTYDESQTCILRYADDKIILKTIILDVGFNDSNNTSLLLLSDNSAECYCDDGEKIILKLSITVKSGTIVDVHGFDFSDENNIDIGFYLLLDTGKILKYRSNFEPNTVKTIILSEKDQVPFVDDIKLLATSVDTLYAVDSNGDLWFKGDKNSYSMLFDSVQPDGYDDTKVILKYNGFFSAPISQIQISQHFNKDVIVILGNGKAYRSYQGLPLHPKHPRFVRIPFNTPIKSIFTRKQQRSYFAVDFEDNLQCCLWIDSPIHLDCSSFPKVKSFVTTVLPKNRFMKTKRAS